MNPFSMYRNLGRPVYVIVAATIVNRFGDFVMPFLALFFTARLGYSAQTTGFAVMMVGLGGFIGVLLGGRIADVLGRRRLLVSSAMFSSLFMASAGLTVGRDGLNTVFLVMLVLFGIAKGMIRPVLRSILTDLSTPEHRKQVFSLNYLGINVGVALGPFLAGFLFETHFHWLFWGDAITSLIAAVLVLLWVPETLPKEDEVLSEDEAFESDPPLKAFFRRPLAVIFSLALAFQAIVYSQFGFTLPLHLDKLFNDSAIKFSHIMIFNAILVLGLTPIFTWLTNRFHALLMSITASLLYMIGFGILFTEPGYEIFFLTTIIWTSGEIIAVIHQIGYFSSLIPANYRGQFNSYSATMMQSARVLSPAISGLLIAVVGIASIWLIVAGLAAFSAVVFFFLWKFEDRLRYRRPRAAE